MDLLRHPADTLREFGHIRKEPESLIIPPVPDGIDEQVSGSGAAIYRLHEHITPAVIAINVFVSNVFESHINDGIRRREDLFGIYIAVICILRPPVSSPGIK